MIAAALIVAVVIVGIGLSFSGGPFGPDAPVMGWFVAHRGASITTVVSVISDCFGPMMVAVWTAVVAIALAVRDRNLARALAVGVGVCAAGLVTEVVKLTVARPRPPLQFHSTIAESTLSYPSGHVTGTCALAVTAALVGTAKLSKRARCWAVTAALLLTVVVAATRLYLGVHWISDVAAGIAVGTAVSLVVPALVAVGLAEIGRRRPALLPGWVVPSGGSTTVNEWPANR